MFGYVDVMQMIIRRSINHRKLFSFELDRLITDQPRRYLNSKYHELNSKQFLIGHGFRRTTGIGSVVVCTSRTTARRGRRLIDYSLKQTNIVSVSFAPTRTLLTTIR